ncbi:MAG: hypothetical protein OJF51_003930 [Nitrospira sp.]|nr:MAG: hypothetical protein OJF51_003930 [Nitrospira sp.]
MHCVPNKNVVSLRGHQLAVKNSVAQAHPEPAGWNLHESAYGL